MWLPAAGLADKGRQDALAQLDLVKITKAYIYGMIDEAQVCRDGAGECSSQRGCQVGLRCWWGTCVRTKCSKVASCLPLHETERWGRRSKVAPRGRVVPNTRVKEPRPRDADGCGRRGCPGAPRGGLSRLLRCAQGFKGLIVDKDTMRVCSTLVGRTEFAEHNVVNVEKLEPQVDVVPGKEKQHQELTVGPGGGRAVGAGGGGG